MVDSPCVLSGYNRISFWWVYQGVISEFVDDIVRTAGTECKVTVFFRELKVLPVTETILSGQLNILFEFVT